MLNLKIDEEFKNKIPPLTQDEYSRLEESILSEGEIREPITVWNGTIIDGHNRYAIWQAHKDEISEPKIREMSFADKWSAIDWMIGNQLGRRNVTDVQRTYLIGKLYEARKHCHGAADGFRGNQHGEVVSAQNEHLAESNRTACVIAEEQGVGKETVKRSEHFSKGLDAAEKIEPGIKDDILSGKIRTTKSSIAELRSLPDEEVKKKITEIKNPKPKAEPKPKREQVDMDGIRNDIDFMQNGEIEKEDELERMINELERHESSFTGNITNCINRNIILKERDDYNERVSAFFDGIVADIESLKTEFIK